MTSGKRPNIERLKRRRVAGALADALHHEDIVVQLDAARALTDLTRSGVIHWEPRDDHERALLTMGPGGRLDQGRLTSLGERAVPTLIACFEKLGGHPDDHGWSRQDIGLALGAIGDVRAVEPLIRILEVEPEVIGGRREGGSSAAEALGMIGDSRAAEPLLKRAHNREHARESIDALAMLLERTAQTLSSEILRSLVELRDEDIRQHEQSEWNWNEVIERTVDSSRVVELAEEEIARRTS